MNLLKSIYSTTPCFHRLLQRVVAATITPPQPRSWWYAIALLFLYGVIYLPYGFAVSFLKLDVQTNWQTVLGVLASSFVMPGVVEELMFRVLLVPRATESFLIWQRWGWIGGSWVLFLLYHLHPLTPLFFREPAFLIGAGLVGIICTVSYIQSRSLWVPAVIHWVIVANWLLLLGGLAKFNGS